MSQAQTIMILTQGQNPGISVIEYLDNQIEANKGKFVMGDFCSLQKDLRPTRLEFRNINGKPSRKIVMKFKQGCPKPDWEVDEYISNQIESNGGVFTMYFPLNAPPAIQLNSLEFKFEA